MNEGDALSFGTDAGSVVHQLDPRFAASGEGAVQVVNGKADMMEPRPPLSEKFPYRGGLIGRFEEFHQGAGGVKAANPRAIRVGEGNLDKTQYPLEKRGRITNGAHGNSDVRDLRAAWG